MCGCCACCGSFGVQAHRVPGGITVSLGRRCKASRRKIFVFLSAVLMIVLVMGTLMYVVEGPANGFTNIPTSVYWAITTMTTVGFGDITPKTDLGRLIASVMMLLGWGTLAVPTGIVTAEMTFPAPTGTTHHPHLPRMPDRRAFGGGQLLFALRRPIALLPARGPVQSAPLFLLLLETPMFETAIAGSLPKPSWLSETEKLWPQWKLAGPELQQAKADATLLWIKAQEDAGLDIVGDGEQSRQHFVHGFLEHVEGIDFAHKVEMGIRNDRYKAMVPQVVAALAPEGPGARV
jgi:hypothetical protein